MKGLQIDHLSAGYGDRPVLRDVSLHSEPGQTTVIMGLSGSGKSTLLLAILGIVAPSQGGIRLDGRDITALPIELRNIGYLPQDYGLFPHLNVLDNVAFGLRMRGIPLPERQAAAKEMLRLVEVEGMDDRKPSQLSGGQRQRVGLARALAIKPHLLLLDEPLSNIDQVTKWDVAQGLQRLFARLDIPILLVTHNAEDAHWFAKHLAILIDGQIAQEGPFMAVKVSPKTDFIKRLILPFPGQL